MFNFIHGRNVVLVDYTIMRKKVRSKEEAELSKLLSFETIKAKTYYQIQKQLSQIAKSQENLPNVEPEKLPEEIKSLNERWGKAMSLLGEASQEAQKTRWSKIVELYFREIDESSFEIFLKDKRKDVVWDCDLVIMNTALQLASFGMDEGYEALAELGIKGDNPEQLIQKIKGRITNHELKSMKNTEETSDPSDFFTMLAQVRKQGHIIDGNILLQEWVGTLKVIQEDNERSNSKA
jgi:hypothetical protein